MKRLALLALLLAGSAHAAIAFRSIGTGVGVTGGGLGTMVPGTPAGLVATDVVVAVFAYGGGSGITITPPSGWTLINRTDNGTTSGVAAYWALGNVASFTFTIAPTDSGACIAAAYSGVDNVTPMDATAVGQNNAASTTVTAPSITTVTANAQLVMFSSPYDGARSGAGTWTAVFGTNRGSFGQRGNATDTTDVMIADAAQAATGASGTKTETYSLSMPSGAILAALRPSAAAATTPTRTLMGVGQ